MHHWLKKFFRVFLETLPLWGLIFVINPILIVFSTANKSVDYQSSFIILAVACISLCVLTAFIVSFFSNKYRQIAIAFLRSLFVVFFVVSIFYPESGRHVDGSEIEDFSLFYYCIIYFSYLVSIVVLTALFWRNKIILRNIYLTFATLGFAAVIYYPLQYWLSSYTASYYSDKNELSFASDKNIVVILADMLQGSTLEQYFTVNQQEKKSFEGFTLFSRATSPFPFTTYAAPAILTGNLYDNDSNKSSVQLLKKARDSSLITDATKSGFDNTVIGLDITRLHNAQLSYQSSDPRAIAFTLFALSIQRIIKKSMNTLALDPQFDPTMWLVGYKKISNDIMNRLMTTPVGKSQNKILFFHSMIPHVPLVFKSEHLDLPPFFLKPLELSVENYWNEMGFFVGQVSRLLEHMKEIGIYDRSLIIITGDHGHFIGEKSELYSYAGSEDFEGLQKGPWARIAAMYNAAILIKPPFKTGELQISRAASSTLGLRPLVQRYLIDEKSDLLKEFEIVGKNKVVVFKNKIQSNPYESSDDHVVLEFAGNVSSLAQEFVKETGEGQNLSREIGPKIVNAFGYIDDQWIKEPGGAWLKEKPAKLMLNGVGIENKAYKLKMVCTPLINKQHPQQRVRVWLNGKELEMISISTPGEKTIELDIPKNLLVNGINEFKFEPLDAISPKEIEAWDFPQPISVYLSSFSVD